jgi:xylose dehydrogenase (NAD/NADP)
MSTDSPRPLKFGILGCARIVKRNIAVALHRSKNVEGVAIASRSLETAQAWAAELKIPRAYGSYEELIADPDLDAVYIPLPNELHREWAVKAAKAGKHVLCEKPLALDAADAKSLVDGVNRQKKILMEAFMWRHHPRIDFVREMVTMGRLGELRLIKMDFSFDIDRSDWRLDPARGGGALYDLGCYGINAARLFTGSEPVEICARCHKHTTGVDMTLAMELRFKNDVLALLDCSFECPPRNRIEIVGTKASVELPGGVLPALESEVIVTRTVSGVPITETVKFPAADQYARQFDIFAESVRAGKLIAPAENGLANMRVLDAVRKQAWGN